MTDRKIGRLGITSFSCLQFIDVFTVQLLFESVSDSDIIRDRERNAKRMVWVSLFKKTRDSVVCLLPVSERYKGNSRSTDKSSLNPKGSYRYPSGCFYKEL